VVVHIRPRPRQEEAVSRTISSPRIGCCSWMAAVLLPRSGCPSSARNLVGTRSLPTCCACPVLIASTPLSHAADLAARHHRTGDTRSLWPRGVESPLVSTAWHSAPTMASYAFCCRRTAGQQAGRTHEKRGSAQQRREEPDSTLHSAAYRQGRRPRASRTSRSRALSRASADDTERIRSRGWSPEERR